MRVFQFMPNPVTSALTPGAMAAHQPLASGVDLEVPTLVSQCRMPGDCYISNGDDSISGATSRVFSPAEVKSLQDFLSKNRIVTDALAANPSQSDKKLLIFRVIQAIRFVQDAEERAPKQLKSFHDSFETVMLDLIGDDGRLFSLFPEYPRLSFLCYCLNSLSAHIVGFDELREADDFNESDPASLNDLMILLLTVTSVVTGIYEVLEFSQATFQKNIDLETENRDDVAFDIFYTGIDPETRQLLPLSVQNARRDKAYKDRLKSRIIAAGLSTDLADDIANDQSRRAQLFLRYEQSKAYLTLRQRLAAIAAALNL